MGLSIFSPEEFDPQKDVLIVERKLPHWSQAGCLCFITFRLADSIPRSVLNRWFAERSDWLTAQGFDVRNEDWKSQLEGSPALRAEFHQRFSDRWHEQLDECYGTCPLRSPAVSRIIEESLRHFDGVRYLLTDFVVMPNHVHLLVAFPDEYALLSQCESWKRFTATQINRMLNMRGRLWQQDGFDHLVRSELQFRHLRRYIKKIPSEQNCKQANIATIPNCKSRAILEKAYLTRSVRATLRQQHRVNLGE